MIALQLRRWRFGQVAPLTLGLTILVSVGGLSFALLQGWPLWLVGTATVIPWLPILTIDAARIFRMYQWLALFYVLVVTQTGHLLEHVAQMFQIHVLALTGADARGIFGTLDIEWVHFLWNTWVLLAVVVLLPMGGMIAQVIVQEEPQFVRRLILAGTGPAGGAGIEKVTAISNRDVIHGLLTFQDPKQFLFFTRTPNGRRAGKEFLARLKEHTNNRDMALSLRSYRTQLKAIHRWGLEHPSDLSVIRQPVLVANGDSDRMVPTKNSVDLARRLPHSELVIYPDAGHGGIFQFHGQFVAKALEFLGR